MAVAAKDHCFTPSNASLVDRYLHAMIDRGEISDNADAYLFHDADVCSARPHDLVRGLTPARVPFRDAGDGMQWFFFSRARCFGNSSTRRSRTVDGTNGKESWHAEGKPVAVEGCAAGGFLQKFSYHVRTAPGGVEKPGWIMAEYTVKDTTRAGDLVLCKVYKSPRGPGRSRASPSSSASAAAAKSGSKRKATDYDEQRVEAATPSTRPRHTVEDDVTQFAEHVERDLLSHGDHVAAPEFVEESQPEPRLVQETDDDGKMSCEEMLALMMGAEADETVFRIPDGEDPEAYCMKYLGLSDDDQQPQDTFIQPQEQDAFIQPQPQDAFIQTVHGPRTELEVIEALATGVTDELLLGGPFMSCPHPGGSPGLFGA